MDQFANKTAVISGGAEGIGLAIARALGARGMNIVLGDIDAEKLQQASAELAQAGVPVLALPLDVAEESQWQELAHKAQERFSKIHMLVNNAGVGGEAGPIEHQRAEGWQWALGVNLLGVVFGTKTLAPLIREHGEGGWLVNVASMAGMGGTPYGGAYSATKTAVVALSEGWATELAGDNIKVSVFCPGFVRTRIHESQRNRQARFQVGDSAGETSGSSAFASRAKSLVENGIEPALAAERLLEAVEAGELYIFTHPAYRAAIQHRNSMIDDAFARAAQSPLLQELVDQEVQSL